MSLRRFQPSNVKCHIRMFIFILHYIMKYVGITVLVPYISGQKGEFIFLGSAQVYLTALVSEESILLVTLVHLLSLAMNIYDKSKQNKHSLKLQRL